MEQQEELMVALEVRVVVAVIAQHQVVHLLQDRDMQVVVLLVQEVLPIKLLVVVDMEWLVLA